MNTRLKYIQYKGKSILYLDLSNMTGAQTKEAIALLDEEAKEMRTWTQKGLILTDFRNSKANSEFIAHGKKLTKEVFSTIPHKSAAIGITGVQNILLQAYNTLAKNKIVPFNTEEEAKGWLIKTE